MKLVLFRHATRSPYDAGDSSLSVHGHAQAEALPTQLSPNGALPVPTRLLVSPKRRAKETFTPLSRATELPLEIEKRLDERRQNESGTEFKNRIVALVDELAKRSAASDCVFLCSHLDWLEAAMIHLPHDLSELEASVGWSAADFKIFKLEDGIWKSKGKGHVP